MMANNICNNKEDPALRCFEITVNCYDTLLVLLL